MIFQKNYSLIKELKKKSEDFLKYIEEVEELFNNLSLVERFAVSIFVEERCLISINTNSEKKIDIKNLKDLIDYCKNKKEHVKEALRGKPFWENINYKDYMDVAKEMINLFGELELEELMEKYNKIKSMKLYNGI
jgi:hypothetical protein